jgi:hypothetical protein
VTDVAKMNQGEATVREGRVKSRERKKRPPRKREGAEQEMNRGERNRIFRTGCSSDNLRLQREYQNFSILEMKFFPHFL